MKKHIFNISIFLILLAMFLLICPSINVSSAETNVTTTGEELIVNGDFSTKNFWSYSTSAIYDSTNKYFKITKINGYIKSNLATSDKPNLVNPIQSGLYKISYRLWKSNSPNASVTFTLEKSSGKETITRIVEVKESSKPSSSSSFYFYKKYQEENVQLKIQSTTQECSSIYIDDISLVQITTPIETETGASIRSSITDSGLRFKGNINKGVYDYLVTTYGESNVEVGMLLAPTDLITDIEDFTIENLDDRIKYKKIIAEKWNNSSNAEIGGYYGFSCVIANIKPENLDRKFSARTYISYIDKNEETTYILYADYNEENHSRSIYEVASKALESEDLDDNSKNVAESYVNRIINLTADDFEKDSTDTTGMTYTLIKKYYRGVLYCSVPEVVTVLVKNNDSKLEAIQNLYYNLSNNENNLKIALSFNNLTESKIQEKLNEIVIKFYVA